jgi:hypothetical protein
MGLKGFRVERFRVQGSGIWSIGVMEYWSVEKKDTDPLAITPLLHYSNTPIFFLKESQHLCKRMRSKRFSKGISWRGRG